MAVPVAGTATYAEAGPGVTSITVNKPTISTNDVAVLIVMNAIDDGDTFTWPTGFTEIASHGVSGASIAAAYKVMDGTEGSTFQVSGASSGYMCWCIPVSGNDTSSPLDVTGSEGSANASSVAIPAVTTVAAETLPFYCVVFDGADGAPMSVSGTDWSESGEDSLGAGGNGISGSWGTKANQTSAGTTGAATVSFGATDGSSGFQFAIAAPSATTVTGSGTPAAQAATASGTGEVEKTGSGTPAAQAATVAGTGEITKTGTGTPTAQDATVSGTGTVGAVITGSGTPTAQSAIVAGTGEREIAGTGTPAAQAASVAGTGEVEKTGTGALAAQSATVAGTGEREITGSGTPAAQASTVVGTGTVGGVITGSGTPAAQAAAVAGTGEITKTGSGTPTAQDATVAGTGEREITGAGAPSAQAATVVGSGSVSGAISGSGTPAAQAATVSGTGEITKTGTGAATAQAAAVSGSGAVARDGTGVLTAQAATIVGSGLVVGDTVTGTGVLAAQSATASGVGERVITDEGTPPAAALQAQDATVVGTAVSTITGSGTPAADAATVAGTGEREITGTGAPASQDAAVAGTGTVSSAGTITGSGSPQAQSASASGTGVREITALGIAASVAAAVVGVGAVGINGFGIAEAQAATINGAGGVSGQLARVVRLDGSYGDAYSTVGVSDKFNRALIGSDWSLLRHYGYDPEGWNGELVIHEANHLQAPHPLHFDAAWYKGQTFPADQFVEAKIKKIAPGVYNTIGLIVRGDGEETDGTFYHVSIDTDGVTGVGYWIERYDGEFYDVAGQPDPKTFERLTYVTESYVNLTGSILRAECRGDTIRLLIDGEVKATATDSTYKGGYVGVRILSDTPPDVEVDNFHAGGYMDDQLGIAIDGLIGDAYTRKSTDSFNRTAMGENWANLPLVWDGSAWQGLTIQSSTYVNSADAPVGTYATSWYVGDTFDIDHYVECEVALTDSSGESIAVQLFVRGDGATAVDNTSQCVAYMAQLQHDGDGEGVYSVWRLDPSFTQIASLAYAGETAGVTGTLRFEAVGDRLLLTLDGEEKIRVTDSNLTGRYVGAGAWSPADATLGQIDNFEAGNFEDSDYGITLDGEYDVDVDLTGSGDPL